MSHIKDLLFPFVNEILRCDQSNESYWAVLSCGAVYYAVQGGSNVWVCGWNPKVWPFKWKLLAVLSCGAVYYAVQGGSNFWVCGWNPKVWPFKWKLLSSTFLWCNTKRFSRLMSANNILKMKATEQLLFVVRCYNAYKRKTLVTLDFWSSNSSFSCIANVVKLYIWIRQDNKWLLRRETT